MIDVQTNARRITAYLVGLSAAFAVINIGLLLLYPDFNAGFTSGVAGLFNMNAELNIPTWYSQALLLCASVLLGVNALADRKTRTYWLGLMGIFLFASIDETASIHELLTAPVRQLLHITSGFLYYSWFIVYGVILLLLVALYLRFYLSLSPRMKWYLLLSAVIFLTGAVGFEAIGASLAAGSGETSLTYGLMTVIEETLEMLGVSIFIYALLSNLRHHKSTLRITFR